MICMGDRKSGRNRTVWLNSERESSLTKGVVVELPISSHLRDVLVEGESTVTGHHFPSLALTRPM